MAFPQVAGTNTTAGSTASASAVVNLPASIAAGDLLLVLHRSAIGTASHAVSGGGWTNLFNDVSDPSDDRTSLWYRLADGTEGATITITQTSSKFASLAWRITGAANPATQAPEFATLVTDSSATPDPGSLTPTGGAKDYLWLWMGGWQGEQTSPPAGNPTNYGSNILGASSGTAGVVTTNCRTASATRELNAASEDPASWTISVLDAWTATVVAVHPGVLPEITTSKTAFPIPPPLPRTQGALGWIHGLLTTTLAPPSAAPFMGSAQDLPRSPATSTRTWTQNARQIAAVATQVRAAVFSLPSRPAWRLPEFVYQNLLLTTLAVVAASPVIASAQDLSSRAAVPTQTWTQNLLESTLAPAPVAPFALYDWPNPRPRAASDLSWLYGLLETTLSAPAPSPFFQTDWPLPRVAVPASTLRTWADAVRLNLLGQDTVFGAAGQTITYDWPNPRMPVPSIALRTWLDNRLLDTLAFIQPRPFAQLEWPVPKSAVPALVLRTWLDALRLPLLGQDRMFGAPGQPAVYAWPNPQVRHSALDLRTAFGNLLENTLGIVVRPFAQYQWPNPIVRVAPSERRAFLNLLENTLGIVPRPFAMLDWPNPRNRIVTPQSFAQPSGPSFFPVFVPAGFILVSGETAIIPTATGEGFIVVTASGEIFFIPTAGGESSVTGSGG